MNDCCSENMHAHGKQVAQTLVQDHGRFLAFVERRVGSRELAEEILQDAYVRSLTSGGSLRSEESVTAWFYRILRNAIVDRHRRREVESRSLERIAAEVENDQEPSVDTDLMNAVCACVGVLVDELKPEYAAAIRRVEIDGSDVSTLAGEEGISPNNARVRLHRAREALKRTLVAYCGSCASGGCRDCGCAHPRSA